MYNVIATVESSAIDKYTRQVPLKTGSVESEAAAYDAIYYFENRIGKYVRKGCPRLDHYEMVPVAEDGGPNVKYFYAIMAFTPTSHLNDSWRHLAQTIQPDAFIQRHDYYKMVELADYLGERLSTLKDETQRQAALSYLKDHNYLNPDKPALSQKLSLASVQFMANANNMDALLLSETAMPENSVALDPVHRIVVGERGQGNQFSLNRRPLYTTPQPRG